MQQGNFTERMLAFKLCYLPSHLILSVSVVPVRFFSVRVDTVVLFGKDQRLNFGALVLCL